MDITITAEDTAWKVAKKLIFASTPIEQPLAKFTSHFLYGDVTTARFTVVELREIAGYLNTYCDAHED